LKIAGNLAPREWNAGILYLEKGIGMLGGKLVDILKKETNN
jgi:hypothetical protein